MKRTRRIRGDDALTKIQTLNVRGEFGAASALCGETLRHLKKRGDAQEIARVRLEAAYAETYLGQADAARAEIARVKATRRLDVGLRLRAEWFAAKILINASQFKDAEQKLSEVHARLLARGETLDAARVLSDLGHARVALNPTEALGTLEEAWAIFVELDCPMERAICEHWMARATMDRDEYDKARATLLACQATFRRERNVFFEATSDLELGYLECEANHFQESLAYSERARAAMERIGAGQEASSSEINIGWALTELNRYDEALPRFEAALEVAFATGRAIKAAVCLMNIGGVYDLQGRFAQALEQYQRAHDILAASGQQDRLVDCDLRLGLTALHLGNPPDALKALDRARRIAKDNGLTGRLAQCELYRGQVFFALGEAKPARGALREARALFGKTEQRVYAAVCDRLWASTERGHKRAARARLAASRAVFEARGMLVDAALCDLTEAELASGWGERATAWRLFMRARRVLRDGFPDQEWRAEFGLGQLAQKEKAQGRALAHFLKAARTITRVRGDLGIETLSNDVYAARARVFEEALKQAQRVHAPRAGLEVIELAKAQTFRQLLAQNDWARRASDGAGRDTAELNRREQELRSTLATLQAQLAVPLLKFQESDAGSRAQYASIAEQRLEELRALSAEYEHVVMRLRLEQQGLAGAAALAPFSLAAFRKCARARWGKTWAALDYYLTETYLTTASVDARTVKLEIRRLSFTERIALQLATDNNVNKREALYRGTLHGSPVPPSPLRPLETLAQRLLPAAVRARRSERKPQTALTLIVSPHGKLHQLPFQALTFNGLSLLDGAEVVYAPSLQALTQMQTARRGKSTARTPLTPLLFGGLEKFRDTVSALPHTKQERDGLRALYGDQMTVLWQRAATRRQILEWNKTGALEKFGVVHLATHAMLIADAPHRSAILLDDADLTVLDVMRLSLRAELVTLSACSTGLGEGGKGDEVLGLARAFFFAGARALVASLWAVDDESTARLMKQFYAHLQRGEPIARALRAAQVELQAAGYPAYNWAAFVAMGCG